MSTERKIKTKDKILITAIRLFNEQGVQNVTSRHIAAEMGIAYGNLNYHYRNKETLLLAIYKRMRNEMSDSYLARHEYPTTMEHFHRLLIQLEAFQIKYRFFNLDVLEISRTFPKINQLLTKTFELRREQMAELFKAFVEEGYLNHKEGFEYGRLQHTIRIIITFWLSQSQVLTHFGYGEKGEMIRHIWELLWPHLTARGREEHQKLIRQYGYN